MQWRLIQVRYVYMYGRVVLPTIYLRIIVYLPSKYRHLLGQKHENKVVTFWLHVWCFLLQLSAMDKVKLINESITMDFHRFVTFHRRTFLLSLFHFFVAREMYRLSHLVRALYIIRT